MGRMEVVELSECTLHLVEYAANRGLARIPQMPRIKGSVLRYLPFFVLMGVGAVGKIDHKLNETFIKYFGPENNRCKELGKHPSKNTPPTEDSYQR